MGLDRETLNFESYTHFGKTKVVAPLGERAF